MTHLRSFRSPSTISQRVTDGLISIHSSNNQHYDTVHVLIQLIKRVSQQGFPSGLLKWVSKLGLSTGFLNKVSQRNARFFHNCVFLSHEKNNLPLLKTLLRSVVGQRDKHMNRTIGTQIRSHHLAVFDKLTQKYTSIEMRQCHSPY